MNKIPTKDELERLCKDMVRLINCDDLPLHKIHLKEGENTLQDFLVLAKEYSPVVFYDYKTFMDVSEVIHSLEDVIPDTLLEGLWEYAQHSNTPYSLTLACQVGVAIVGAQLIDEELRDKQQACEDYLKYIDETVTEICSRKSRDDLIEKLKADESFMRLKNIRARYDYVVENYPKDLLEEANVYWFNSFQSFYTRFFK